MAGKTYHIYYLALSRKFAGSWPRIIRDHIFINMENLITWMFGAGSRFSLQGWERLHGCLQDSVEKDPEAVSRQVWALLERGALGQESRRQGAPD